MTRSDLPTFTPWGAPQTWTEIAPSIWAVSTSSHGGLYVTGAALDAIPTQHQAWAAKWSHGMGAAWFEEDCCAYAVIAAHPAAFPDCDPAHAARMAAHYSAPFYNREA